MGTLECRLMVFAERSRAAGHQDGEVFERTHRREDITLAEGVCVKTRVLETGNR